MPPISLRRVSYDQRKQARLRRQRKELDRLRELPLPQRAEELYTQWKRKVPQVVWKALTGAERAGWLACQHLDRSQREFDACPTLSPEDAQRRLNTLGKGAMRLYAHSLREVLVLLTRPGGPHRLILHFYAFGITGPSTEEPTLIVGRYETDAQGDWGAAWPLIVRGVSLGLLNGGTVIFQQQLPMRVERVDENGDRGWEHQTRIYGASLGMDEAGVWEPLAADNVRAIHFTNALLGSPGSPEAGVSFAPWPRPSRSVSPSRG